MNDNTTQSVGRYRALCCACGTLRTVHPNYQAPYTIQRRFESFRITEAAWRSGPPSDVPANGRALQILKCATCREWREHALILDGNPQADRHEEQDHAPIPVDPVAQLEDHGYLVAWAPNLDVEGTYVARLDLVVLQEGLTAERTAVVVAKLMTLIRVDRALDEDESP